MRNLLRSPSFTVVLGTILLSSLVAPGAMASESRVSSPGAMMSRLMDGEPTLAKTKLDPSAYVETKVQKLAHAQILYVNWPAIDSILKELGFKNPPTHLTAEVAQAITDSAGWAIPLEGEAREAYVEQVRSLYSIRYGGRWLYYNLGSGRNGAGGEVDFKGIGPTALVRAVTDGSHSNGVVNLWDAIKESVWAGALHHELPYAANQVLFIIGTGTTVDPKNPDAELRTIIVRQDPLRPAYFQRNQSVDSEFTAADKRPWHVAGDSERMQKVLPRLFESLPGLTEKEIAANRELALRKGILNFVDRVAHQYATGYTRQILLAAISTSNVEISGRAMDFGSTQALIGFPRARVSSSESPQGSTGTLKNDLVFEWVDDLRNELPADLARALPTNEELGQRMDQEFARRTRQGFLELAGSPLEFSEALEASVPGKQLSLVIQKIAQAGNDRIEEYRDGSIVGRTGTYNLDAVLNAALSALQGGDRLALAKALPNAELRAELLSAYGFAYAQMLVQASAEKITEASLKNYMRIAVKARNRSLYGLRERWKLWPAATLAAKRLRAGDSSAVQDFIDQTLEKNVHEFKAGAFEIETSTTRELQKSVVSREIFNLKTGETRTEISKTRGLRGVEPVVTRAVSAPDSAAPKMCRDIFG